MKSSILSSISYGVAGGGTISGDVTIDGDLTVNGDGSGNYDEIVNGALHIDHSSAVGLAVFGGNPRRLVVHAGSSTSSQGASFGATEGGGIVQARIGDKDGSAFFNQKISGTGKGNLELMSKQASASDAGLELKLFTNDGAAMGDGHRLGVLEFAGAEDGSSNITVGARIEAVCDAAWSSTENGAYLSFYTTDGDASQAEKFRIDNNSKISLSNNDAGASNTIFGHSSGANIASGGDKNTLVGKGSGNAITTGDHNTHVGWEAGYYNATSSQNTSVGSRALTGTSSQNAQDITAIGYSALIAAYGNYNTAVGSQAGYAVTNSTDNVFIGYKAGYEHATGNSNVVIGSNAMNNSNNMAHYSNVIIGNSAWGGAHATAASHSNVAIGQDAMDGALNGATYNVAIGRSSLAALTEGDSNIALGYVSGNAITNSDNNIFIGHQVAPGSGTHTDTIIIGKGAGCTNAYNNSYNVFIGQGSGSGAWGGESQQNVALGNGTLKGNMNGANYNTAIGYEAGNDITTADACTVVGHGAGDKITTGGYNTFVGANAGDNMQGGTQNTAMGYEALGAASSNSNNVAVGVSAGGTVSTGGYNTLIGANADVGTNTDNYHTGIGDYGCLRYKTGRVTILKADSADNSIIKEVCKIPANSIIHRVTATVSVKSTNLSTYNFNLSLSTSTGTAADGALANASSTITNPEILGAGAAATYSQNSGTALGTAADLEAGSGATEKKVYTNMPTTTIVGTADTYLYICNAGTGNGTTDSSSCKIDIVVEYQGID